MHPKILLILTSEKHSKISTDYQLLWDRCNTITKTTSDHNIWFQEGFVPCSLDSQLQYSTKHTMYSSSKDHTMKEKLREWNISMVFVKKTTLEARVVSTAHNHPNKTTNQRIHPLLFLYIFPSKKTFYTTICNHPLHHHPYEKSQELYISLKTNLKFIFSPLKVF